MQSTQPTNNDSSDSDTSFSDTEDISQVLSVSPPDVDPLLESRTVFLPAHASAQRDQTTATGPVSLFQLSSVPFHNNAEEEAVFNHYAQMSGAVSMSAVPPVATCQQIFPAETTGEEQLDPPSPSVPRMQGRQGRTGVQTTNPSSARWKNDPRDANGLLPSERAALYPKLLPLLQQYYSDDGASGGDVVFARALQEYKMTGQLPSILRNLTESEGAVLQCLRVRTAFVECW
jgi:hypothetical protein